MERGAAVHVTAASEVRAERLAVSGALIERLSFSKDPVLAYQASLLARAQSGSGESPSDAVRL